MRISYDKFSENIGELVGKDEFNKLICDFNKPINDWTKNTIDQLFVEKANNCPNHIAVRYEKLKITYRELNDKSSMLASYIDHNLDEEEKIIGILMEQSINTIIVMLAILKSGKAYLPMDMNSPDERICYTIKNSKLKTIFSDTEFKRRNSYLNTIVYDQEDYLNEKSDYLKKSVSTDIAYIIYTSGSTGLPKGVLIEHRNVLNTLLWRKEFYKFSSSDNVLQFSPLTFDSSVEEIFVPLLSGSTLHLLSTCQKKDMHYIANKIKIDKITHFTMTPSLYRHYLTEYNNQLKNVRFITVAGDVLTEDIVKMHYDYIPDVELYNGYGPTEGSICTTVKKILPNEEISIGKPITNTNVLILDDSSRMVPIGSVGEICICGHGVARGYLDNDGLNKLKFSKYPINSNYSMYRTGDLGKWLPNGEIKFLGRNDLQVKIRGIRIELGEIEKNISDLDSVREVFVFTKEDSNFGKFICAAVIPGNNFSMESLKSHILMKMPDYMLPRKYVILDQMPLTLNGKIDKKKIKSHIQLNSNVDNGSYLIEGANDNYMVSQWKEILTLKEIPGHCNFFDYGGDSLKAMVLLGRINKMYKCNISYIDFIETPTLIDLKNMVMKTSGSFISTIKKHDINLPVSITSTQEKIMAASGKRYNSNMYKIPMLLKLDENINMQKLINTINKIVENNHALRIKMTRFNGEIVQNVNEFNKDELYTTVTNLASNENILDCLLLNSTQKNILDSKLFSSEIIVTGDNGKYLFCTFHHILFDAVSIKKFQVQLDELYYKIDTHENQYNFCDYALWKISKEQKNLETIAFWKKITKKMSILELEPDYIKNKEEKSCGYFSSSLTSYFTSNLKNVRKKSNVSSFIVLLTTFLITMNKLSNSKEVSFSLPIADRTRVEFENIIGLLVDVIFATFDIDTSMTVLELLHDVNKQYKEFYQHREISNIDFLEIAKDNKENISETNNVLFNYLKLDERAACHTVIEKEIHIQPIVPKYDLSFTFVESGTDLVLNIEYDKGCYKYETIKNIFDCMKLVMQDMLLSPSKKITKLKTRRLGISSKITFENNSNQDFERIDALFSSNFKQHADRIAIINGNSKLTYKELDDRISHVSNVIISQYPSIDIIGILMNRSVDMIISIYAVLKSGRTFVPLTPDMPKEQIDYIVHNSEIDLVITNESFDSLVSDSCKNITYNQLISFRNFKSIDIINAKKTDIAYIMYTSGSTGKPKGVRVTNKNVVNLLLSMQELYPVNSESVFMQKTTFSFDVSIAEIFGWFFCGASLYILPHGEEKSPSKIVERIINYKITHVNFVPSMLRLVIDYLKSMQIGPVVGNIIKYVFSAGEEMVPILAQEFYEELEESILINVYGPTETTVYITHYKVEKTEIDTNQARIPIGKLLQNNSFLVLDDDGNMIPQAGVGELCIAGANVTAGYIQELDKKHSKFTFLPSEKSISIYRTGDYVRLNYNDDLEYIGRKDSLVKIRGLRIDLKGIESTLVSLDGISGCIVTVNKRKDGLILYYTENQKITEERIRAYLTHKLPIFMIPNCIIRIEEIPLLKNNKVDLFKLETMKEANAENEVALTENEYQLYNIWCDLLGLDSFNYDDDFYNIGGNSLLIYRLFAKVFEVFQVNINYSHLSEKLTVKSLSKLITSKGNQSYIAFSNIRKNKLYCFPPIQGFGYFYKDLAVKLNCTDLVAFNFYKTEDIIVKYAKEIIELNDKNDIYIMGFCVGGRLAYHVAKKIEEYGGIVKQLILIDTMKSSTKNCYSYELIQEQVDYLINIELLEATNTQKEKTTSNILEYYDLLNNLTDTEQINGNITFIASEDIPFEQIGKWSHNTKSDFHSISGIGNHGNVFYDQLEYYSKKITTVLDMESISR